LIPTYLIQKGWCCRCTRVAVDRDSAVNEVAFDDFPETAMSKTAGSLFLVEKSLRPSAATASESQDVGSVIVDLGGGEQHDRAAAGTNGVLAGVQWVKQKLLKCVMADDSVCPTTS